MNRPRANLSHRLFLAFLGLHLMIGVGAPILSLAAFESPVVDSKWATGAFALNGLLRLGFLICWGRLFRREPVVLVAVMVLVCTDVFHLASSFAFAFDLERSAAFDPVRSVLPALDAGAHLLAVWGTAAALQRGRRRLSGLIAISLVIADGLWRLLLLLELDPLPRVAGNLVGLGLFWGFYIALGVAVAGAARETPGDDRSSLSGSWAASAPPLRRYGGAILAKVTASVFLSLMALMVRSKPDLARGLLAVAEAASLLISTAAVHAIWQWSLRVPSLRVRATARLGLGLFALSAYLGAWASMIILRTFGTDRVAPMLALLDQLPIFLAASTAVGLTALLALIRAFEYAAEAVGWEESPEWLKPALGVMGVVGFVANLGFGKLSGGMVGPCYLVFAVLGIACLIGYVRLVFQLAARLRVSPSAGLQEGATTF